MPARDNVALAWEIYDAFNDDDFDRVLENAAENVEVVMVALGQTLHGHEGFRQMMQGWKTAFPDMKLEVAGQVAGEDGVATELVARGAHTGPLAGPAGEIPPTGRSVELRVAEVWKVGDGKLTSLRNYQDTAALMQQLGVIPAPEPAEA